MASLSTDANGNRRILFRCGLEPRKTLYLGKTSRKRANTILAHVEELVRAILEKHAPDPDTSEWVGRQEQVFYDKLVAVGLVQRRAPKPESPSVMLAEFIDQYIAGRTDVKPRTVINDKQARGFLVEFFGANRPMPSITPGDGDDFRRDLMRQVGPNTARRHCGRAKQFFRAALRKRLIQENPFADMKDCSVRGNKDREYFIEREDAAKVLEACPDAEWRLLFALSRFGGLRCPSEHLELRLDDINWELNRMTVRSPKTEHFQGKESRQVPIFPELRPYLQEVWDSAEPGNGFLITRYRYLTASGRPVSLGIHLRRIIEKAGLKPWPKIWQNLRSTRETELAAKYPMHVVCAWIGNSERIAAKHYLQVTDKDFDRAISDDAESDARRDGIETTQPVSAISRQLYHETCKPLGDTEKAASVAVLGNNWQDVQYPRQDSDNAGKPRETRGVAIATTQKTTRLRDLAVLPDIQGIVAAHPGLSNSTVAEILEAGIRALEANPLPCREATDCLVSQSSEPA